MALGFACRVAVGQCASVCALGLLDGESRARSVFRLGCGGDRKGRRVSGLGGSLRVEDHSKPEAGQGPGLKSDPHKLFWSAFFCLFYPSQNAASWTLNAGTGQHGM